MATETIVTGKKYRILTDAANKVWNRVSFWHKASDCEFNDGKTAEAKLGVIDGITDSTTATSSRIAASAKAVSSLSSDLAAAKTSFQDGCSTIAAAITAMGVSTASNATPATMAANIKKLGKATWKSETIHCSSSGESDNHFYYGIFQTVKGKTLFKDLFYQVTGHNGHGGGSETVIDTESYNSSTGELRINGWYSEPSTIKIWYT